MRLGIELAAVQRQRRTMLGNRRELGLVDVDRDHAGAEGARHLHAVAADATGADHDGQAARRDAGAAHRLVGRGQRVGDDRDLGQRQPGGGQALLVDLAQAARRAPRCGWRNRPGCRCPASSARGRSSTRPRRHRSHSPQGSTAGTITALPIQTLGARAAGRHASADLVAQRQRQRVVGAHAVVEVAQIGVADAAAGNRNRDLAGPRRGIEGGAHERRVGRAHQPAVGLDGGRFIDRFSCLCESVAPPRLDEEEA